MADGANVAEDGTQSESKRSTTTNAADGDTSEQRVLREQGSVTARLLYSLTVIALGSSFQFGYNIGAINAPDVLIKEWILENHNLTFHQELSDEQLTFIWSAAVSLFPTGAMLGALSSGFLADKLGRRTCLHANNALALLAGILMGFAKSINFYPVLHAGRFVIGVNAGISSSVVPMYVTELSPLRLRGSIGSLPQLVVTISILLAQIMGLPYIFGTTERWPFMFGIVIVPALLQIVCLFFVPESPKFSLMFRNDAERALDDLRALRDDEKFALTEFNALEKELRKQDQAEKVSVLNLLASRSFRWPLFLAAFLMMAQQMSGINAAMFFSTEIFRSAGIAHDNAVYATIGVGIVNVLMTVLSIWMVDSPMFGRRSLLLIGKVGMIFASIALVISIYCFRHGIGAHVTPYMACAFLPIFVIFFATGPGSIPFFYVSEVFPSNARASASAVCVAVNWTFTVLVGLSFLPVESVLHEFTFLIFTVSCAIATAVVLMFLPETKGKTLEEVEVDMDNKRPACC